MADATADDLEIPEGEAAPEPKRKRFSGKKIVLFMVLPALLLLGGLGGGAAWYLGFIGHHAEAEKAKKEAEEKARPTVFYDLPEMLVNLNTNGKQASYLKLRVSLELDDPEAVKKLEQVLPRVIDNFQVYLRELRPDDLNGSAGLFRLKEELLLRVNTAIQPIHVRDVLFKDMLVQ